MSLYETYNRLKLDGSWIGLARADGPQYFCTPVGAEIIGWDNGIHYCFIKGFGEMVFCVNPETCCDRYVYPIAENFRDFLRLILAAGNTNTLQQIICWNKTEFEDFASRPEEQEYVARPEVQAALYAIRSRLDITPMEAPFEYVKALQSTFSYENIHFTHDYYDTLGLERPDRTEPGENRFEFTTLTTEFRSEKD